MYFRIRILVENTCRYSGLVAEHGLSLWIESEKANILFDLGQTSYVLENNLNLLGIDLSRASHIVLSHGHYDHCGGLGYIVSLDSLSKDTPIFAHPYIVRQKLKKTISGLKDIGVSDKMWDMAREKFLLNFGFSVVEIASGIFCLRGMNFESNLNTNFVLTDGSVDEFEDETYLLLVTGNKGVLISGCGHRGVEHVVKWVINKMGIMVVAVVGGLHMTGDDSFDYRRRASILYGLGVKEIYPMHCVLFAAKCAIKEGFAGKVGIVGVGDEIIFS